MIDLVYCAGGNKRFAQIAVDAGFLYGCPSNRRPTFPPAFIDLDYRQPDFARHLAAVQHWRPRYAIAGDAETAEQLAAVLAQAAALEPHAEYVIVVPKQPGLVELIPARYVIGVSVPTRFGATQAPFWEYRGRRCHLLGGSPNAQMLLARYLTVVSADGNGHQKAARWGTFWTPARWVSHEEAKRRCPAAPGDLPYRAFAESCREIKAAWGSA